MILIADSGSTKTDWCLISKDGIEQKLSTEGLNPLFADPASIRQLIQKSLSKEELLAIKKVYVYSAGCYHNNQKKQLRESFLPLFNQADINIETDLIGAARAAWHEQEGAIGILGTGSNSGVYNGKKITQNLRSPGYILGDEGSAAYFGKKILQHYLHHELPGELTEKFTNQYQQERDNLIEKTYTSKQPNRFLASFSLFAVQNQTHPFINQMLTKGFEKYFQYYIFPYEGIHEIRFVGSIAKTFHSLIKKVASNYHLVSNVFIKYPIEQLAIFHQKELKSH